MVLLQDRNLDLAGYAIEVTLEAVYQSVCQRLGEYAGSWKF